MKDNEWFTYISKDKKVRGIIPARDEAEVARMAGYPIEELVIEQVIWDGKQFREDANST